MATEIAELIGAKKAQVQVLQEQIRHLELAAAVENGVRPGPAPRSGLQMVELVLQEVKRPLHAQELTRIAKEKYGMEIDVHSVSTQLARAAKGRRIFARGRERNTFGLLEWQQK